MKAYSKIEGRHFLLIDDEEHKALERLLAEKPTNRRVSQRRVSGWRRVNGERRSKT